MSIDTRRAVHDTTTETSPDLGGTTSAWALVARREILIKLTDKGFVIGTLVTLAILGAWLGYTVFSEQRTSTYAVVTTAEDARPATSFSAPIRTVRSSWPPTSCNNRRSTTCSSSASRTGPMVIE